MTAPFYLQPHTADSPPAIVCGSERVEFDERAAMYWAWQLMNWLYWNESLVNNEPSKMGKTPNNLQYSSHSIAKVG